MARALIIGGSLGGLFAGLLLRQAGWDVTVKSAALVPLTVTPPVMVRLPVPLFSMV